MTTILDDRRVQYGKVIWERVQIYLVLYSQLYNYLLITYPTVQRKLPYILAHKSTSLISRIATLTPISVDFRLILAIGRGATFKKSSQL